LYVYSISQIKLNALRFSRLQVGKVSVILRQLYRQDKVEKRRGSDSAETACQDRVG